VGYLNIYGRPIFLSDELVDIVNEMGPIEFISLRGNLAKFLILRTEEIDGQMENVGYEIVFAKDAYGNWSIESF